MRAPNTRNPPNAKSGCTETWPGVSHPSELHTCMAQAHQLNNGGRSSAQRNRVAARGSALLFARC
eukprot:4538621-Prymnesium_polylepis.1